MASSSEDDFTTLVQQNEGIIHKVINLYIDNKEDQKDLFQEILLQAWKSFSSFQAQSAFSTWLYRVALNTVFNFRKKQKTIAALPEKAAAIVKSTVEQQTHEQLYLEIKKLNPVDKALITLHLDGYKNMEIAEMLGMSKSNVGVKIHRIKNAIIQQLKSKSYGSV